MASLSPPRARIDVNVSDHDAHIAVNLNEDDADFTKFKKDLPKNASELLKGAAYWEFEVNVAGKEKPRADTSFASEGICKAILEKDIEDVIVMSHGWNTARDKDYHYVDFNNKMAAALLANDPRKKRKVLIVGLCWPRYVVCFQRCRGSGFCLGANFLVCILCFHGMTLTLFCLFLFLYPCSGIREAIH